MNKKQTRIFALASTAIATLVFIALTIDSHRQFPKLTNAQNITPAVTHGKDVWHKYNCINCHTLFGEAPTTRRTSPRSRSTAANSTCRPTCVILLSSTMNKSIAA